MVCWIENFGGRICDRSWYMDYGTCARISPVIHIVSNSDTRSVNAILVYFIASYLIDYRKANPKIYKVSYDERKNNYGFQRWWRDGCCTLPSKGSPPLLVIVRGHVRPSLAFTDLPRRQIIVVKKPHTPIQTPQCCQHLVEQKRTVLYRV